MLIQQLTRLGIGLAAAERTIESINDFSLPLCLINLRLLFSFECDNDVKKRIYDVVFEAAKSNMHKGQSHWIDVVGTLHADAAKEVSRIPSELQFDDSADFLFSFPPKDPPTSRGATTVPCALLRFSTGQPGIQVRCANICNRFCARMSAHSGGSII